MGSTITALADGFLAVSCDHDETLIHLTDGKNENGDYRKGWRQI